MATTRRVDAIVVGAGIAGASAACALSGLGYRVLVIDAGQDHARRLSGELIHPAGVTNLRALGLLGALLRAGAIPIRGFAVFSCHERPSGTPGASDAAGPPITVLLDYPAQRPPEHGLAVERATMMTALLGALAERRNIELWQPARVTGLNLEGEVLATATVRLGDRRCSVSAPLLVAADGRNSFLRKSAGIRANETRVSLMLGYELAAETLPFPGYGHVFVGGRGPVLAYPLDDGHVRMMVDVPGLPTSRLTRRALAAYACALPSPFVQSALEAMVGDTPLVAPTHRMLADEAKRGCMALVGDAAGCCHPLSASGMSFGTRDALWLRQALEDEAGDIPRALRAYAWLRARPQCTRYFVADLLYNMFSVHTPGMRLLCSGSMRHWQASARARETAMSILATRETRLAIVTGAVLGSVAHALPALWSWPANPRSVVERCRAVLGLLRDFLRYVRSAARPLRS